MEQQYTTIYSNIKNIYITIKDNKVVIKAPKGTSKKKIETLVKEKSEWIEITLKKSKERMEKYPLYTIEEFKEIVEKNANDLIDKTGLVPDKIRIKKIKYAWGSCSSKKNITINTELIKYSNEAIRYVILHELCHLKYMNHSKKFWDLVEKYMKDYKEVKKQFK